MARTESETETETEGAAGRRPRPLSRRERDVLVALIIRGTHGEDETVTDQDRARWLEQVAHTRAGRGCSCGTCPSIELTDTDGVTPDMRHSRVVLQASTPQALLLLFVDDDRLSYLELAPLGEEVSFHPFPDVADIAFGH